MRLHARIFLLLYCFFEFLSGNQPAAMAIELPDLCRPGHLGSPLTVND